MNSNDSQQSLSESQLLINSLLSVINPAEEPKHSFEETFDRQNAEQTNTEETTTDEYDWECLNEPEEEDISVEATRYVSSFAETVSINERVIELKAAFEVEFPLGKTFVDKDTARLEIQSFSKANKIPFETCKSDKTYIKMICKHFGKYRAAKKGEDEEDFGTGEGLASVAQRPNRTIGRTGCSAFDMNKSLSQQSQPQCRRPKACNQFYACWNDASETLKMLAVRGVNNLINFIKNLESSVRYMTNADERICCVFFIHQHGIDEARKPFKCVVIDATHKTNSHKMVLLNFVVAGTLRSKENPKRLVTVPIAGCWMDRETGDRYRCTGNLPKCFVMDNDEALLGAIKSVFPESKQILCWIHIQRNFITVRNPSEFTYRYNTEHLLEMEVKFFMAIIKQMALTCATKSEFLLDKDAYEAFVRTKGMCVKVGAQSMIKYLHHMMVKKQFWVGYYANNLMHMGNRTSNKVEPTHANVKRSNNTSSGRMAVVTEEIDLWIKKSVRNFGVHIFEPLIR
ncbi:hypothetical protein INT47_001550 [Mucor saturninus]|uniref:MULE transposase domain-containing protein n=1 Tax=Mucor saturninus TaxID=64648 RepID=A0A8H7QV88_9FUNG|nr:hypothetical protein INT47_001550 [Mucor saturninus]